MGEKFKNKTIERSAGLLVFKEESGHSGQPNLVGNTRVQSPDVNGDQPRTFQYSDILQYLEKVQCRGTRVAQ